MIPSSTTLVESSRRESIQCVHLHSLESGFDSDGWLSETPAKAQSMRHDGSSADCDE